MKYESTLEMFLIRHLLEDFIPKFECWIEIEVKDDPSKDFYKTLIRLFKGQIKAWRRWRLEHGN